MKKFILFAVLALVISLAGSAYGGAFDKASTTGEIFRDMVVLKLFTAEDVDSAVTVYSSWVKIADANAQKAIFWVSGTCDSTATYQLTFQVSPVEDSSYSANAVVFDSINSGVRTITYLDLTNYAFPWARLKVVRIEADLGLNPTSALTIYMALIKDAVFTVPAERGVKDRWHYETGTD